MTDGTIALGSLTCPSGILVILDPGFLRFWSGRDEPKPPVEEFDNPDTRAFLASSADYIIIGRDAATVARLADLQKFHFVYDLPAKVAEQVSVKIAEIAANHGLEARLEREPRRIPHRERAQRAADLGGGDFVMEGPWVAIVGGLPPGPLMVRGRRQDYGGHVGVRWAEVWVVVSDRAVKDSTHIGYFGVDYGLALLGDVDALEAWQHRRPLDGLLDVAFWGRDAQLAARELGAEPLAQGWGWRNITQNEARARLERVQAWLQSSRDRKLAFEPRPHSHFYRVLEPIRQSADGVGELELSGARLFGLATSWGDGMFAVWVDRDDRGDIVAIRLELGNEKRRQLMEKVWQAAQPG